jgi:hypothetical protein
LFTEQDFNVVLVFSPYEFLLKDVVLLGAALLTAGEALRASQKSA